MVTITVLANFILVQAVAAVVGRQHQLFKIQTSLNTQGRMLRPCWAQLKSSCFKAIEPLLLQIQTQVYLRAVSLILLGLNLIKHTAERMTPKVINSLTTLVKQ